MRSLLPAYARAVVAGLVIAFVPTAMAANLATYEITADDMCCSGCAKKIAAQLYTAPGVKNVKANVAARTVTVFAKPSEGLTVERLWNAVEKGKGGPSKIVTATATYTLLKAEVAPDQPAASGPFVVAVSNLRASGAAEQVGRELQGIRGVASVTLDPSSDQIVVEAQSNAKLSPLALAAAVERAKQQPILVDGPHGRLTIESNATQLLSRQQAQGEVR